MKDPRTIDGEWNAIRRHTLFDDYDDPDAHSPLAALDPPKRIGPATWITPLTAGAVLLGCLVCWSLT